MPASAPVVAGPTGSGSAPALGAEAARLQIEVLRRGYVERLPEAVRAIEEAVAAGGGRDPHVLVHRLRGSAAVYGCLEISRVAADLEDLIVRAEGRTLEAAAVNRQLTRLRRALDRTLARRRTVRQARGITAPAWV